MPFHVYILWELFALSCLVLYVMFSFCDGFRMRTSRKVMWGVCVIALCYASLAAVGHFMLPWIVAFAALFALCLAWFQNRS